MKTPHLLLALCAAIAGTAQAQVITIDQAKALAGHVTPGDAPGYPVTISQPGSYQLTSNLSVADVGLAGIHIQAEGVTIDLNGFTLSGARCGPARCHIGGGGAGIVGGRHATVTNGTVTNFADSGVHFTDRGTLVAVRSHANGRCGAIVNSGSLVRDSAFTDNAYCGLWMGKGLARNNLVTDNQTFQVFSAGFNLFSGNNIVGVNAALPATQSLGDNLCAASGQQQQHRC